MRPLPFILLISNLIVVLLELLDLLTLLFCLLVHVVRGALLGDTLLKQKVE